MKGPENQKDHRESTGSSTSSSFTAQLQTFFDQNGRYIQYGAIGVGIAGIVVISRSLRLGTKFTNAAKIPKEFYEKNVNLYGRIKSVEVEKSALLVEHLPILRPRKWLSRSKGANNEFLRLQIPGLEIYQPLEYMLKVFPKIANTRLKFTLLQHNDRNNSAQCLVTFRRFLLTRNFAIWCVRNNIATMKSSKLLEELPTQMWNNKKLSIYYKPLFKLEVAINNKRESIRHKIWSKLKSVLTRAYRSGRIK